MTVNTAAYDVVLMGATGFVGQLLCEYLWTHLGSPETAPVRWAIAGRNLPKLHHLAQRLSGEATGIPAIVADSTDLDSLRALCAQTRVVVSTVGPYARYGDALVQACAETGTDYADLTGEPQWIRRMMDRHGDLAQQSGAHIVHCCGFDSIPSDLGVYYLQQQAQRQWGQPCDRVKMRLHSARGGVSGGTAASGVNLVAEAVANPDLQRELTDPYSLCPPAFQGARASRQLPTLIPVQYDDAAQSWVAPFVMAVVNTRVVLRSNALLGGAYGPGFCYDEGVMTGDAATGWLAAQAVKWGGDALALAAALPPTRWLLDRTLLPAPGTGPSATEREQGFYDLRFWGRTADGRTLQLQVRGDLDPGYGSTAKLLAQAALCLAEDVPALAKPGGFWTPAALMGDALRPRLEAQGGLTFTLL
jgi:short subunit dehydrogenase-like uncharacterized protein